jgi:hypothetical protein
MADEATTQPLSLRDVTALAERAATFIGQRHVMSQQSLAAIEAIQALALMARRALPAEPPPEDLRWAVMNDPMCAAAFKMGQAEARRQPFGFTREDVAKLNDPPELYGGLQRSAVEREWWAFLDSLAHRIAALLPRTS